VYGAAPPASAAARVAFGSGPAAAPAVAGGAAPAQQPHGTRLDGRAADYVISPDFSRPSGGASRVQMVLRELTATVAARRREGGPGEGGEGGAL
jgi:hypothetical protein